MCKLPVTIANVDKVSWLPQLVSYHGYMLHSYHCWCGQVIMVTTVYVNMLPWLPWLNVCGSYQLSLLMWTCYHGYHSLWVTMVKCMWKLPVTIVDVHTLPCSWLRSLLTSNQGSHYMSPHYPSSSGGCFYDNLSSIYHGNKQNQLVPISSL